MGECRASDSGPKHLTLQPSSTCTGPRLPSTQDKDDARRAPVTNALDSSVARMQAQNLPELDAALGQPSNAFVNRSAMSRWWLLCWLRDQVYPGASCREPWQKIGRGAELLDYRRAQILAEHRCLQLSTPVPPTATGMTFRKSL